MPWRQLSLKLDAERCEAAEDTLLMLGALALTLEDASGQPLLEPGPGETPLWQQLHLHALFEADCDTAEISQHLFQAGLVADPTQIRIKEIADQVWERVWMERFKPMSFGKRLWIYPTHIDIPDQLAHEENVIIRLDPGLAFGSGTHPTTAMCLRWLDRTDVEGLDIVDYGCGSGVLAIAAALCGARRVWCVDHDEQALLATRENAVLNGVTEQLVTCHPEDLQPACADVVLANILAGVLCELSPVIRPLLKQDATLIMSGMLTSQVSQVQQAYAGLGWQQTDEKEWSMLCGHREVSR